MEGEDWQPEETAPERIWLRTRREGEAGENVCFVHSSTGTREWVEREGGRTTVTHHSFAPPTQWKHLDATPRKEG